MKLVQIGHKQVSTFCWFDTQGLNDVGMGGWTLVGLYAKNQLPVSSIGTYADFPGTNAELFSTSSGSFLLQGAMTEFGALREAVACNGDSVDDFTGCRYHVVINVAATGS